MKIIRIRSRFSGILALAGSVACAPGSEAEDPCALTIPPVAGWSNYDEGDFTVQLPPDYTRVPVQGIDSRVGSWEAPGKRVSYDFGVYANTLQPDEINQFADLVVCQESDGPGTPRIVRYSADDGGYGVGAHWPDVKSQGPGMVASLTLQGVVQEADDQGEILAIIRSVQIKTSDQGALDSESDSATSAGAAGAGPPSPSSAEGPDQAGYRAAGNEPFWTLRFGESTMSFTNLGNADTVSARRPEAERLANGWRFTATANQGPFVVEIQDQRCSDSMSGRPFPHTVMVTANGQTYTGCGGSTMSLLTEDEWRVTSLESAETTGSERPTLLFAADGALTGNGGCNRFRATYQITGEGIGIGPAMATKRACAEPEANAQETRFFALLEQVTRFEFADDDSLLLLASDRPVITAQH